MKYSMITSFALTFCLLTASAQTFSAVSARVAVARPAAVASRPTHARHPIPPSAAPARHVHPVTVPLAFPSASPSRCQATNAGADCHRQGNPR